MNAKIAKELRQFVTDSLDPSTPVARLLAKPVRTVKNGQQVTVHIAINATNSFRGAYRKLKRAVEQHPEMLEQLRATAAYKKMLDHERSSGSPTFV